MAEPHIMASTTWGAPPGECSAATPNLLSANPADKQVLVTWEEVPGDPELLGYKLYYDQAGKAQLVTEFSCPNGSTTACDSFTDTGLTNGQEYCYKVTSYGSACESEFSNILCAIPTQPGQAVNIGVIAPLQTGSWVTEGKGKNATTEFVIGSSFSQGDSVVIQASVHDQDGLAVAGATITFSVTGPE
jgi:hypothetical protein